MIGSIVCDAFKSCVIIKMIPINENETSTIDPASEKLNPLWTRHETLAIRPVNAMKNDMVIKLMLSLFTCDIAKRNDGRDVMVSNAING